MRDREPEFAFLGALLGAVGVLATAAHGAFDIAGLSKTVKPDLSDVPNFVDPRGFTTFGITGLALLVFGVLGLPVGGLDRMVARLAVFAAVLLAVLYVGRLTLTPRRTSSRRWPCSRAYWSTQPSTCCSRGRCCSRAAPRRPVARSFVACRSGGPSGATRPATRYLP